MWGNQPTGNFVVRWLILLEREPGRLPVHDIGGLERADLRNAISAGIIYSMCIRHWGLPFIRGIYCLVAALTLAPPSAWAASTYTELLQENFATALDGHNDPRVPDDIELKLLNCLASAFVNANIPSDDLTKLDQAVVAGTIELDPLAGKYAMLASDSGALMLMSAEAERLCPDTLKAYDDAKKG